MMKGFSILVLVLTGLTLIQAATADTLYVDSVNGVDNNNRCTRWDRPCQTLARAVVAADADDTVELLAQDYSAENILIDKPLTFIGINKNSTRIIGSGVNRHFTISLDSTQLVTFKQMTLADGNAGDEDGGSILVNGGHLELLRTILINNRANQGGAVACEACSGMFVHKSELQNNVAGGRDGNGGAVYASYMPNNESSIELATLIGNRANQHGGALFLRGSKLRIDKTTFSENGITRPSGKGGAVFSTNSDVEIQRSTFYRNRASMIDGKGGGLYAEWSTRLWLTNNTFSENGGGDYGGAVALFDSADSIFTNNTFYANQASVGGATFSVVGAFELRYSIIANSLGARDCVGDVPGGYYNSLGDASCLGSMTSALGPVTGLGSLQDNGGPTATHAIVVPSNAHNAVPGDCFGPDGQALITDQLGENRPFEDCDLGAFEYQDYAPGSFIESAQNFDFNWAGSIAHGDVDGDGDEDLIVGNIVANSTRVFMNNGSGRFSDSGQALGIGWTSAVALGDIDGDGDLDLIEAHYFGPNYLVIYPNDGSGTFTGAGQSFNGYALHSVALGDIDGDGDLDIAVGSTAGDGNLLLVNNGSGRFHDSGQSLGSNWNNNVILGDIDGDGDLDMLAVNTIANVAYLNDGHGVFLQSNQTIGTGNTKIVRLGDLDGDGDLDLVEGNLNNEVNHIYINNGRGFHDLGQTFGNDETQSLELGDIDMDGDLDIVQGTYSNGLNTYLNDGYGNFTSFAHYSDNLLIDALVLADMDNDGDLDIASIKNWAEIHFHINKTR